MDAPTWVYASIAGVTVLHLFVLVYLQARRRGSPAGAPGPGAGDAAGDADESGDTVCCRQCGAENERRFRFCRRCVTELPGATLAEAGGSSPGIL